MRVGVQSSFISFVDYNERAMTLDVWLHNGHGYRYFYVTAGMYAEFMSMRSKGSYYNSKIKRRLPSAVL